MGYPHYWKVNTDVSTETWNDYKKFVRKAIELIDGNRWGNSADGDDKTTLLDCVEPVNIRGGHGTGDPYVASENVETDDYISFNGDAEKGHDHETFYVSLDNVGFNFCKTARKPYDTIVLACIIAGEKMGVFSKWSSDASSRDEMKSGFALFYKTMENL